MGLEVQTPSIRLHGSRPPVGWRAHVVPRSPARGGCLFAKTSSVCVWGPSGIGPGRGNSPGAGPGSAVAALSVGVDGRGWLLPPRALGSRHPAWFRRMGLDRGCVAWFPRGEASLWRLTRNGPCVAPVARARCGGPRSQDVFRTSGPVTGFHPETLWSGTLVSHSFGQLVRVSTPPERGNRVCEPPRLIRLVPTVFPIFGSGHSSRVGRSWCGAGCPRERA